MDSTLKKYISDAISFEPDKNIPWLVRLIKDVYGMPLKKGEKACHFDGPKDQREILCEIAEKIVDHNAIHVFTSLCNKFRRPPINDDIIDIANLPMRDGRKILDYAQECNDRRELVTAIIRNGGEAFPVNLHTARAKESFAQWQKIVDYTDRVPFIKNLITSQYLPRPSPDDIDSFIVAALAHCVLTGDQYLCKEIIVLTMDRNLRLKYGNDLQTLSEKALSEEKFEITGALNRLIKGLAPEKEPAPVTVLEL